MITNTSKQTISSSTNVSTVQEIKLKEKIGYGFGDFASQLLFCTVTTFLTFYYTDTIGIAAGVVGTLMLVARVLDAFVDIGVGVLIDKTKSRHGKARPWLIWMAVPFSISGVILFTVPTTSAVITLIYVYVTYLLMNFIYSAINVPYGVINSLITQDAYQRSVLNIFRMVLANVGALLVTFSTLPLVSAFGDGKKGWIITISIYGILGMILFFVTFASTKERVKPSVVKKDVPLKRGLKALFRNKYWALMVVFAVAFFANNALGSGINVYYAQYILNDKNLVGMLGMATLLPQLAGFCVLAFVIKYIGKRNSALVGSVIMIVGSLIIAIQPHNLVIVMAGLIIKALGTAAIMGTVFAMLADTVEYGEWRSGVRTEGLVYSAGSFGTKAGSGLGIALVGWGLAIGGYVGGQTTVSALANFSIQFMFIYLPVAFCVIQIAILWFYKLDQQYSDIVKELQDVRDFNS
ncbi:MFS transporter [Terrilactibacillus laevilacticus]|uniref:Glycoside-pentoside-hexuronide (GPH):cation symporter n=1 Tax=Terrilactibacillus laevilacticus TaxID=1380157 RepID=A0ABW5PVF1_9BACI|nr:MFS transporter [Terrilactibacillus laevilacticus]